MTREEGNGGVSTRKIQKGTLKGKSNQTLQFRRKARRDSWGRQKRKGARWRFVPSGGRLDGISCKPETAVILSRSPERKKKGIAKTQRKTSILFTGDRKGAPYRMTLRGGREGVLGEAGGWPREIGRGGALPSSRPGKKNTQKERKG